MMNYYYFYYLVIIIISNSISVFGQNQEIRTYREVITKPVVFTPEFYRTVSHTELPIVKDELSITLKINLAGHAPYCITVFHKDKTKENCTPSLFLSPNESALIPSITITSIPWYNFSIANLVLNQWHHIAYTLSDPEKRLNIYIDGKWVGSLSIQNVQNQSIIFNDSPLYIGKHPLYDGINGQISNFRYYNYCLSHNEVLMDYLGDDPTKSIVDESPIRFFGGLGIGIFLCMAVFICSYYIKHSIRRPRGYRPI
ncbi:concanavalin A-like lectin/glucanase [Gigaspora margarita]|uniref:Concanavalin A-like lectin/glucanase n=1 Tax=Gigaspora margarita TaxID=4874 RepID=A0A8H4EM55_GIGMA|nr:concanavalin A-like lectin/glucanase [Gigaspora margarita]